MKLEKRQILNNPPRIILIAESDEESELMDEVFGSEVKDDGFISNVSGQVKVADGFMEHYISLQAS